MDISYHYPPELLQLLVDTIPRLCRGKNDVLLFFRGAGVEASVLEDLYRKLRADRYSINKFEIARTVLQRLNEQGETTLRERREVVRRVVEFEDFSTCWPNDVLKAKGLVSETRRVVNVKDSFTKMRQEREIAQREHTSAKIAEAERLRKKAERIAGVRGDLNALFASRDPGNRGIEFERVFNRLFEVYGVLVRESFRHIGDKGEGVIEQIDGVIELDGELYLVEMKWLNRTVGVEDVSRHLVRVFTRDAARGIFISATEFSAPALATCKESLSKAVICLCTVEEIVHLLEREADLAGLLTQKVRAAILDKRPYKKIIAE